MHLMAMCLLLSAMVILVTSDSLKVEDCDASLVESMRAEMLQSSAVLSPMYEPGSHTHKMHTRSHFAFSDNAPLQVGHRSYHKLVKPLYWVHVPKCNSGFIRSVLFLPTMCQNMSEAASIKLRNKSLLSESIAKLDFNTAIEDECPGDVADLRDLGPNFADHSGIGSFFLDSVKGHGMIFLRQPEQRLISAWNDEYHSWPTSLLGRDPYNINEFASFVSGCATKMLTRHQVSDGLGHNPGMESACGDPRPISEEESNLAITRLRKGFIFVGLIEKYDLSICLLHAMFGGECSDLELAMGHSESSRANNSWYDTSMLQGWKDVYDGRLYAEAQAIFQASLESYRVTNAFCQECWAQAGLTSK